MTVDVPMVDAVAEERGPARRESRRLLGSVLVAYGLLGLIVFVAGAILVNEPLGRLAEATSQLDEQRLLLAASLRTTSTTLDEAAAGLGRFDESIGLASGSAGRAAALSREVAATMAELARSMRQFQLFGQMPLAQLAAGFERADQQLRRLGEDLEAIGGSLGRNAEDARATRAGIERLQGQLGALADSVEGTTLEAVRGEAIEQLRLALVLIAAWLALLALGSVITGLHLLGRR